MMSAYQVAELVRKAARQSARNGVVPLLIEEYDLGVEAALVRHLRGIPFIGDRCPRGWKRLHAQKDLGLTAGTVPFGGPEAGAYVEVDSSGFGQEGEIALTFEQFVDVVRKAGAGIGWAMVEQGQFQVVVGAFKKRVQS